MSAVLPYTVAARVASSPMLELFTHPLLNADHELVEAVAVLRWGPLTALFVLLSAWWIKGPVYIVAGVLRDLRRGDVPLTGLAVFAAVLLSSACSTVLKELFDRDRPPLADPDFEAAVGVPASASFPSGHASTAFAAAAALALLVPSARWPALLLASGVALSRVYLGVHYALDVVAGAALGVAVALLVVWGARRVLGTRIAPAGVRA
jgi:undecaprenyl-diphosphatase